MAAKTQIFLLLDDVTVDSADEATQAILNLSNAGLSSVHVGINNTDLVGTVRIQGNNDSSNANLKWIDLLTTPITTGDDLDQMYDLLPTASAELRLLIDYTSGTGTVTVVANQIDR